MLKSHISRGFLAHWIGREHHAKVRNLEAQLRRPAVSSEILPIVRKAPPPPVDESQTEIMSRLWDRFEKQKQSDNREEETGTETKVVSMSDEDDRWEWDEYVFMHYVPPRELSNAAPERRRYEPGE